MKARSTSLVGMAGALAVALAPPAFAEPDRNGTADELSRVSAKLEAAGYTDVHDLELDDGRFEVDARNAKGQAVDLELDESTFVVLYEDLD
jgi:hypothetical protein